MSLTAKKHAPPSAAIAHGLLMYLEMEASGPHLHCAGPWQKPARARSGSDHR